MTEEQRHAIEWAIGMASQHNIHKEPLRQLLANPSDKQEAVYNCGECACLPGFCDEEGKVRNVLRMIVDKIDAEGPSAKDWRGFNQLCEIARLLLDNAPLAQSAEQDRIDAERYRWLRDEGEAQLAVFKCNAGEYLDAAIDAAISKGASK